jgi:hypothetical protein
LIFKGNLEESAFRKVACTDKNKHEMNLPKTVATKSGQLFLYSDTKPIVDKVLIFFACIRTYFLSSCLCKSLKFIIKKSIIGFKFKTIQK